LFASFRKGREGFLRLCLRVLGREEREGKGERRESLPLVWELKKTNKERRWRAYVIILLFYHFFFS